MQVGMENGLVRGSTVGHHEIDAFNGNFRFLQQACDGLPQSEHRGRLGGAHRVNVLCMHPWDDEGMPGIDGKGVHESE